MNILDFLFPRRCVGCGSIGSYLCKTCKKQVVVIAANECVCPVCDRPAFGGATHARCTTRYGIDGLTSFFYYTTVMRELIRSIKYRFVWDMLLPVLEYIPRSLFGLLPMAENEDQTVIIPIPLHKARLRYRGFNQAEKIGGWVSNQLIIPQRTDVLFRVRHGAPQVSMNDRNERLKNMRNMFAVNPETTRDLQNFGVFLVDDVFTTGATMRSAATALKRAGAGFVWGVTIAR